MDINLLKYSYINDIQVLTSSKVANNIYSIIDIINEIKNPKGIEKTNKIKQIFSNIIENNGSVSDAKKAIEHLKKKLPAFQLSGSQKYGHGKPTVENPFTYNGCFQIDIDLKYKGGFSDAKEIKQLLQYDTELIFKPFFAANSPTYGLKMLIVTDSTNIENHGKIGKALKLYFETYFSDWIENSNELVQIDYCEVYKTCFVPFDAEPYVSDVINFYCSDWFLEYYNLNIDLIEPRKAIVNQPVRTQNTTQNTIQSDVNKCKYYYKNLCERLLNAKEGEKHSTRAKVAYIAGGNAAQYGINYDFALNWILKAAIQNTNNEKQAEKTIKDQFDAGFLRPKV